MRYLDGFRDADAGRAIAAEIRERGEILAAKGGHVRMMEVCGTHTMSIARYGIRDLLPENVKLAYAGRVPSASTAVGSTRLHRQQQEACGWQNARHRGRPPSRPL